LGDAKTIGPFALKGLWVNDLCPLGAKGLIVLVSSNWLDEKAIIKLANASCRKIFLAIKTKEFHY